MSVASIKITTSFEDKTKREYEISPLAPTAAAVTNVKTNIANFNSNIANFGNLIVSDSGATCTGITAASVTVTNEREINLNE